MKISLSQVNLPKPKEDKQKKFVKFGTDNKFPNYLIELLQKSAIHNAIVTSKTQSVIGKGFTYEGADTDNLDAKTELWLKNPNPYENANSLLTKITNDFEIFNGYYLGVIWAKDKKTIAEIYHYEFDKIRCGKKDDQGNIIEYYYSIYWSKMNPEFDIIPAFDEKNRVGEQILFIKPYVAGQYYYPLPSYVGAIPYIELDGEVANFHLANVKNGMNPSQIITIIGEVPTQEEKTQVKKGLKDEYTSTDNAGNIIVAFAESKDNAPVIQPIAVSDLDKQFDVLSKSIMQNILTGHRVTSPMLVGIKTEGQLGGATELMTSFQIYDKTVIEPDKQLILTGFNKIAQINGLKELYIESNSPVEFTWSETALAQIMTKDEMRAKIGLDALSDTTDKQEVALIEKIGIGGTQAMQGILTDTIMSNEMKKGILKAVFGLSDEQIASIIIEQPTI